MAECEWEDSKSLAQAQSRAAGGSEEWSSPGGGSVWVWRKYGEKLVSAKKQALKRSYFRCVCSRTHAPCPARKRIDRIVAGPGAAQPPLSVSLISRHNHTLARQARAEGAEGNGRCSSCAEEGPAARPGCWCLGLGAPLQRWGLETWCAQELAREMCSDLVSPTPSNGTPGGNQRSTSLRSPPPPPPALTLALPLDVSRTPESESAQSHGLETELCWLGEAEELWDAVSPEGDADTDGDADAEALGQSLSVPLRFSSGHPPFPPAASQKWRLPSMRAFREERRVRSQDFDCPTRGPLGLEHATGGSSSLDSRSLEFDWGAQGQCFEWPAPGSLHHGIEQATGGSSGLGFDWGDQGQGFECGTPGTMESPWELCSGRREGHNMGTLLLGEEGEKARRPQIPSSSSICKKRKKGSEDVPTILAKLRKMLDARSGKSSPPSPSGIMAESNSGSQDLGGMEVQGAEDA